jgi:hypothetical protein
VVDRFQAKKWNLLTYLGLGALAVVGEGWRQDARLVAPFLLVGLVAFVFVKHRLWRLTLASGFLFVIGAGITHLSIHILSPRVFQAGGVGFHFVICGESTRCNLLGLENSFQMPRDDYQTYCNAVWFEQASRPGIAMTYLDQTYGAVCREMYMPAMKCHLFQYLAHWPEFYFRALGAFSDSGGLQGEDLAMLRQSRLHWALPAYDWCLDYLIILLPFLHFAGILTFYWMEREKVRGTFLILFSVYYSVILFAVMPDTRHLGQLLLPLAVTGGFGLWGLFRSVSFFFFHFRFRNLAIVIPKPVLIASSSVLAAAFCWGLACLAAYSYSTRHRDHFVNDIMELAVNGVEANNTIKDPHVFSVTIDPQKSGSPTGYLLSIQANDNPGLLECCHVNFQVTNSKMGRVFVTRHKLYPSRLQSFAVTCVHSQEFGGDIRPYACTVTIPFGSSIVGCRQLDLSSWKRLPFSTVFFAGEHLPGSPVLGRLSDHDIPKTKFNNLSSEISYRYPWHTLSTLGLPWDQNFNYPGLRPLSLVAAAAGHERTVLRCPRNQEEARETSISLESLHEETGVYAHERTDGLHFRAYPVQPCLVATSKPFVVEEDGVYLMKVKYLETGMKDFLLKAIPVGDFDAPHQQCISHTEDDLPVKFLEMRLKAGKPFQLQLLVQSHSASDGAEILIQEIKAYREKFPHWDW